MKIDAIESETGPTLDEAALTVTLTRPSMRLPVFSSPHSSLESLNLYPPHPQGLGINKERDVFVKFTVKNSVKGQDMRGVEKSFNKQVKSGAILEGGLPGGDILPPSDPPVDYEKIKLMIFIFCLSLCFVCIAKSLLPQPGSRADTPRAPLQVLHRCVSFGPFKEVLLRRVAPRAEEEG